MNKNLTVQNVGILFELGFNVSDVNVSGVNIGDLPNRFIRVNGSVTTRITFWANDIIQVNFNGQPDSTLVNTFTAAMDLIS